jgi:Fur family ferric uptake transcriptional regulator
MHGRRYGWHGRLRESGYRLTEGRKEIINILTDTKEHLSAEEIYFRVHKNYPAIGLTSVYRTLDVLVNMGVIQKFDFGDGRFRYEIINGENKGHRHLICTKCRKIINYNNFIEEETELLKKTEKELSEKYKFEINSNLIQFYGLCPECRQKK